MANNVELLQKLLSKYGLDGYLIPSNDEYFSEMTPNHSNRLKFITNFTGSAGMAIILDKKIYFFTDGRYEIQAKNELPKNSEIFISTKETISNWLSEKLSDGKKIGFDSKMFNAGIIENILQKISRNQLIEVEYDLVDNIRSKTQMQSPPKIFIQNIKNSSQLTEIKLKNLLKYIANKSCEYYVLEDGDSISWLLNLRCNYYEFTPTIAGKLIVSENGKCKLYLPNYKLSDQVKIYLKKHNIEIFNIEKFYDEINLIKDTKILLQPISSYFVKNRLLSPIADLFILKSKAIKDSAEISGAKEAHIQDANALKEFIQWFKTEYKNGNYYTEFELAEKLSFYRQKQKDFYSLSFPAIVAFKENGAITHYRPNENSSKLVKGDGLLLIDSGGQYFCGTTDITRVFAIGKPTKEQIKNYTLVLKGHIKLASAKFPIGTSGSQLDCLARIYLWKEGLDYQHGTGHGVGSFLNVHEGPYGINKISSLALEQNVILSIEPGYYKAGEYGIRIENLYYVDKSKTKDYFEFKPLTLFSFEEELINCDMLNENEKTWLNQYQKLIN